MVLDDNHKFLAKCAFVASTNDISFTDDERIRGIKLRISYTRELSDIDNAISCLCPKGRITQAATRSLVSDDIARLMIKRSVVDEYLKQLCIAFSSEKRLPSEVLARIFTDTIKEEDDILYPIQLSQMPWVLTRVCSRWRSIARAEPRLWSAVSVKVRWGKGGSAQSFLQDTLPPTGPLSIRPYICGFKPLEAVFLPYFRRVKKLDLTGCSEARWSLNCLPPSSFSELEDLTLDLSLPGDDDIEEDGDSKYTLQILELFKYTTTLRRLAITAHDLAIVTQNPHIPLTQLWHLDLAHVYTFDFEMLIQILRSCAFLRSLIYPIYDPVEPPSLMGRDPILPCLLSLKDNSSALFHLPLWWDRLTTLILDVRVTDEAQLDGMLDVLEQTSQLEILEIFLALTSEWEDVLPLRVVTLKKLNRLSISELDIWFFQHLKLPGLSELRMEQPIKRCNIPGAELLALVTRSRCDLRTFNAVWSPGLYQTTPDQAFREFLSAIPSLRELYVRNILFDVELLQGIKEGVILPRLRVLHVDVNSPSEFMGTVEGVVERCGELSIAYGYHIIQDNDHSRKHQDDAEERLWELNLTLGSDFRLIEVGRFHDQ